MMKPGKIPKISPKTPKILPASFVLPARGGLPAAKLGGIFQKKLSQGGCILSIPPWPGLI